MKTKEILDEVMGIFGIIVMIIGIFLSYAAFESGVASEVNTGLIFVLLGQSIMFQTLRE